MSYHYSIPPPGYVRYNYTTSPETSPSSSPDPYRYYTPPQQYYASPTNTKRHVRSKSYGVPREPAGWPAPTGYPPQAYYRQQPEYASSPSAKRPEHVSNFDRQQGKPRRPSVSAQRSGGSGGGGNVSYSNGPRRHASVQSPKQRIIIDTSDDADDSPTFTYIKPRTGPKREKYSKLRTDQHFYYNQETERPKSSESPKTRPRKASQSRPSTATKSPPAVATPRDATAADAAKHRIPAGYSLKNWDPTEAPVILLGSVFDANSLGKWIYDWTVFHHGPVSPLSEVAGDLWLLLIKLAGKMKRADECLPRVRAYDNQEMLEDFLESGDRLWGRFKRLLKACEEFMWKVTKKEGAKGTVKMGKNSGCEFVDSIFGRDRKLEETESLMQSIRLWNMRFDANCEGILKRPHAP